MPRVTPLRYADIMMTPHTCHFTPYAITYCNKAVIGYAPPAIAEAQLFLSHGHAVYGRHYYASDAHDTPLSPPRHTPISHIYAAITPPLRRHYAAPLIRYYHYISHYLALRALQEAA